MEKDISVIPEGLYCYSYTQDISAYEAQFGFTLPKTKRCPYWSKQNDVAHCAYLDEEDDLLLGDQCKICGINED